MYVSLNQGSPPSLEDRGNYRELKVVADRAAATDLATGLGSGSAFARADGEHAWIRVAWLDAQLRAGDGFSAEKFGQMLAYARSKGWWDEQNDAVRGHVEIRDSD